MGSKTKILKFTSTMVSELNKIRRVTWITSEIHTLTIDHFYIFFICIGSKDTRVKGETNMIEV